MSNTAKFVRKIAILTAALTLTACCIMAPQPKPTSLTLQGQPSWFDLGGLIYQEGDVEEAQKEVLKFVQDPQWFKGYQRKVTKAEYVAEERRWGSTSEVQDSSDYYLPNPPPMPKQIDDLPTKSEGATLDFSTAATPDPHILAMTLTLKSSGRAIVREVEHRWTNVLPFLFAVYVDGKAVQKEAAGFSKEGGVNYTYDIVDAGGKRDWKLRVDAETLADFLPDRKPHHVTLVAAFSERQHEGYSGEGFNLEVEDVMEGQPMPQILLRSNPIHLQWTGTAWKSNSP